MTDTIFSISDGFFFLIIFVPIYIMKVSGAPVH